MFVDNHTPVNQDAWTAASDGVLKLSPPDSPYPEDLKAMLASVRTGLSNVKNGRLGILGLTHDVIKAAESLQREWMLAGRTLEIEVIDCRKYFPSGEFADIRFREANWLTYKPDVPYDVVIGDDVLCNIEHRDMPSFFRAVAGMLTSRGSFVTRTTGIFGDRAPPAVKDVRRRLTAIMPRIAKAVKAKKPAERQAEWNALFYEVAWPILHSVGAGYDRASRSFETRALNKLIGRRFKHADACFTEGLKMTSMPSGELKKIASAEFKVVSERQTHSIWEKYKRIKGAKAFARDFKDYYRVMVFQKQPRP